MSTPPIALLTDFGASDGYVGVMKGVILGIAPGAALVDLTHEIPPQDVVTGAWVLHTAWRYFPADSVFLCVVDPGVGSARRPIALRAGGRSFVGPDNGLFTHVVAGSGVEEVVVLDDARFHLPQPSATFHGRDIFAPCAAHLAAGTPLQTLGTPVSVQSLVSLALLLPEWRGAELVGHVLHVDHFGNLITDISPALTDEVLTAPAVTLHLGSRSITARAGTFAEGPEGMPFALRDSSGHLALAVRNGSVAALLGAGRGDAVVIEGLRASQTPDVSPDVSPGGPLDGPATE